MTILGLNQKRIRHLRTVLVSRFSFEARRTCWRHVRADKKERGAARPEKQTAFNTTVRSIASAEMSARTSSAVERRKKTFKKTIDADESRRKREDNIIELRKAKRDESLQKKRATNMGPAAGGIEESNRSSALVAARVTHFHIDLSLSVTSWPLLNALVRSSHLL